MSEISDFQSLLQVAAAQPEPQRLLFVFAKVSLPKDHDALQAARYREGLGGGLVPVMCVDKAPEELTSFEALAAESRRLGEPWQMLLVAALSGQGGRAPTPEQTTATLRQLVQIIHSGGDLSPFLAFDSGGEPLRFL